MGGAGQRREHAVRPSPGGCIASARVPALALSPAPSLSRRAGEDPASRAGCVVSYGSAALEVLHHAAQHADGGEPLLASQRSQRALLHLSISLLAAGSRACKTLPAAFGRFMAVPPCASQGRASPMGHLGGPSARHLGQGLRTRTTIGQHHRDGGLRARPVVGSPTPSPIPLPRLKTHAKGGRDPRQIELRGREIEPQVREIDRYVQKLDPRVRSLAPALPRSRPPRARSSPSKVEISNPGVGFLDVVVRPGRRGPPIERPPGSAHPLVGCRIS
jgi:hypothetical protein